MLATDKGYAHESGLFVHHKAGGGETEYSEAEGKYVPAPWKVSHQASGLSVGAQFKTKADAQAAAEKLAPIADWHKDADTLPKDHKLQGRDGGGDQRGSSLPPARRPRSAPGGARGPRPQRNGWGTGWQAPRRGLAE